jgi:ATP-dependent helicase YprA (DUF1998 family)
MAQVIEISTGAVVDQVEEFRAFWEIHEGAMYMNQGVTYKVRNELILFSWWLYLVSSAQVISLDMKAREARVRVSNEQYYTVGNLV